MPLLRRDPELLRRFRAGERSALETIYRAYFDAVARVMRDGVKLGGAHRVPGAGWDEQRDLIQNVFVRAFSEHARMGYDGIREYKPYLLTICRNVLIDWARTRNRELPTEQIDALVESDRPEPATEWENPAVVQVVERYVASLDPLLRSVHEQRFVLSVSQVDAAAALGVTRQNIRTLEKRLREGLEEALKHAGLDIFNPN